MYIKLLKNDLKKNPGNNVILFLFMSLSVTLAVSVFLMLVQLFTSISTMYETAKPPHFLQMHKGVFEQEKIDGFNRTYPGMEYWQTVSMINVYGEELMVSDDAGKQFTLSDCRLGISLVKQNEEYDVLLDEDRNKVELKPGEIGVPVILLEQYKIAIGDKICLKRNGAEKTFIVSDYVYDGQMNSTLCSSTRFLISDKDFSELFENAGEKEYIIEAYFTDSSMAAAYQNAYEQSDKNLPKDGQAVTYPIIFLLSAMTDIMMAMVFLLTGILLIVIAFICLRYTILAELEDDKKEIGTMKAMGISEKGIRNLYLAKIRILMAAGCVSGFLLALCLVSVFTEHMKRTFGEQPAGAGIYLSAVFVCAAVYGVILTFAKKVLGKVRKADVVDLLITEKGFGKTKSVKDGIHKARKMPLNLLLGLHEVRHGYGIIFALLLVVSCTVSVPYRVVHTMENKEFSTYMGSTVCDVLLEVEQGEGLEDRKNAAEHLLLSELEQNEITTFELLKRVRLQALGQDGKPVGIHIDTGKSAGSGLQYLTGGRPVTDREIALSVLMAEELGKEKGDKVILVSNGMEQEFSISGIYQDVTSGGKTAKTVCDFSGEEATKYTFQINLNHGFAYTEKSDTEKSGVEKPDAEKSGIEKLGAGKSGILNSLTKESKKINSDCRQKIENWREQLGNGYSINDMETFLNQTLGGVSAQLEQAVSVSFFIGMCLTVLIILLFMKLRIAREAGTLAAKRAMGIPFFAICIQELYPVLIAGGLGTVAGVVLSGVFGDDAISLLFQMMGIGLKQIKFATMPILQQLLIPVALIGIVIVVTYGVCTAIRKIDIVSHFEV